MDQTIASRMGWTIGMDLGDRFCEGCVQDEGGEGGERFRVRTRRGDLEKRLGAYAASRVILEVGTHSPWISRVAAACGHDPIAANPRRVRLITSNDSKSDTVDAELLAPLGRIDPNLLKPVVHRGEQAQRDRILLQARNGFVRARTELINQARSLAKSVGRKLPSGSTPTFTKQFRASEGGPLRGPRHDPGHDRSALGADPGDGSRYRASLSRAVPRDRKTSRSSGRGNADGALLRAYDRRSGPLCQEPVRWR